MLVIPNNPLVVAVVQAICAGGGNARLSDGGWRRARDGEPYYEFWSGSGGWLRLSLQCVDAEAAWRDVEAFSTLTLDVLMSILACLCSEAYRAGACAPRREPVWLGAPAVLMAKDYGRFGEERRRFADAIDEELMRLLRLRFDIVSYPGFDPTTRRWNRAGVTRRGVTLFERANNAQDPDAYDCNRSMPLRFGVWAEHWLHGAGPMWLTRLPVSILRLDHRENRGPDALAKRIALLLVLNWGAARRTNEIRMELRTLLRRLGELRRPSAEPLAQMGRFVDRVEEAVLRLGEQRIMRAGVATDTAAALRVVGRRWVETWLNSQIVFERPDFLAAPDPLKWREPEDLSL